MQETILYNDGSGAAIIISKGLYGLIADVNVTIADGRTAWIGQTAAMPDEHRIVAPGADAENARAHISRLGQKFPSSAFCQTGCVTAHSSHIG